MIDGFHILLEDREYMEYKAEQGMRLCDIASDVSPGAVCAVMDGSIFSLADEARPGAHIKFLYPEKDQLASRVFLRGATFLLYCAAKDLFPGRELTVEHALYGGMFCTIPDIKAHEVSALQKKVEEYIAENEEFILTKMHVSKAKKIMLDEGLFAKAALLDYRPFDYYRMYEYKGHKNYFHGIMPKSSGYLAGTRLFPYAKGFILKYPAPYIEASKSIADQPKYSSVFAKAEEWARVLHASYISDINGMLTSGGIYGFIDINEALHEIMISNIAQQIADRKNVRIVLIAGPSSSGKTTFASRLAVHLRAVGKKCRPLSLDNYYKNRDDIPVDEKGEKDLESIEALDVERLNGDLGKLLACEVANLPRFDFYTGKRKKETVQLCIDDDILVIEGIHGLNGALTKDIPADQKFKIFVSPLTTLNIDEHNVVFPDDLRLIRRLARDKRTRGYSFEQTFAIWDSVRRGEYKYILPYQETADVMFNTTLLYEPLVLKKHCYGDLMKFKSDMPYYSEAHALLKFLNYVLSFEDETTIPIHSLLREFIGPIKI
jgi:uridine kinase